jgi:hypothetical protein
MSTIAGYTICFTAEGQLRQITVAERDDDAIDRMLRDRFGAVHVLSRMALDSRVLDLLKLRPGDWLEWTPVAHGNLGREAGRVKRPAR